MKNPIKPARAAMIGGDLRSLAAAERLGRQFDIRLYGFEPRSDAVVSPEASATVDKHCCSQISSRTDEAEHFMRRSGLTCESRLESALEGASAAILPLPSVGAGGSIPMPFSSERLYTSELLAAMERRGVGILCGGMLPGELCEECTRLGIDCFDYYDREEFAVANAVPTAEAAIAIALGELDVTLCGANVLVIGHGRIGRMLVSRLVPFACRLTVAARKPADREWIIAAGSESADSTDLAGLLSQREFDLIINTVPSLLLGRAELELIAPGVPIIDLASKPGGIDSLAAAALGHRVLWALSLPGRNAPISAGRIVADTLLGHFSQVGLC